MRVLIIGASGFIGGHLVRRLSGSGDHEIFATLRSGTARDDGNTWCQVELTDPGKLEQVFQMAQPDAVVHLAAMADVGTAEREPETATAVNVTATSSIVRLCEQHDAKLVFVSTEYVFNGERGYYREDEPPNPTTHYGLTKWEAEQEVAKLGDRGSIVRTSIVYGWPAPGRRNFALALIERLRSGRTYEGPTDVYRTPIYVEHLTEGIAGLLGGSHSGIHHIAGRDWVSMCDFAAAIAEGFGLDGNLVLPVTSGPARRDGAEVSEPGTAPPASDLLGLDCARTMRALGLDHPGLAEGIAALRASAPVA